MKTLEKGFNIRIKVSHGKANDKQGWDEIRTPNCIGDPYIKGIHESSSFARLRMP